MTEIEGGFTAFGHRSARRQNSVRFADSDSPFEQREPHQFNPDELNELDEKERRWSWVEVDLNSIRLNCSAFKQRVGHHRHVMAVVNADGFGHGAVRVAKTALNSGADYIGVATVNEGIELREALVNAPILVLSQPPAETIPLLLAYKLMPSVHSSDFAMRYAEAADSFGMKAPYHLAVNTGMNRIGISFDQVASFLSQIGFHRALDLKGTFTTFATPDRPEGIDFQRQVSRFVNAIQSMQAAGFDPGIIHAADSATSIIYPQAFCDMVRVGAALYGFHTAPQTRNMVALRPAMSVHARITDARLVSVGEGVSYGLSYRSAGSIATCTLPIGYGDGLSRMLSNRINVIYRGQLLRQVGDICMDQCMFEMDLRSRPGRDRFDPQIGDEVVLVGRQGDASIAMEELADLMGTIPNEVCIGFARRLPRVYV